MASASPSALVAVVGVVSGSDPALALSRFSPARVLKASGRHASGDGSGKRFRQGLVVVQFAVSIVLMAGTLVAWQQFNYIQTKRLGLNEDRVIAIEDANVLAARQPAFVDRVRQLPGVATASAGDALFPGSSLQAYIPDQAPASEAVPLRTLDVGYGFLETMDIEVTHGRSFDPARRTDSAAVLVNRAAVEKLGWSRPEGHRLRLPGDSAAVYDVIGFVADFHYTSMRQRVQPLLLSSPSSSSPIAARTTSTSVLPPPRRQTSIRWRRPSRRWPRRRRSSTAFSTAATPPCIATSSAPRPCSPSSPDWRS